MVGKRPKQTCGTTITSSPQLSKKQSTSAVIQMTCHDKISNPKHLKSVNAEMQVKEKNNEYHKCIWNKRHLLENKHAIIRLT
uniref:Uncharacterized protein n=1 Tax=Arundo donax TaxID=35708 RepID=A0A0A9DIX4_ARUDO